MLTLLATSFSAIAASIDPAFTTPAEQSRQNQLESQEQLRQQQILKSLRQQQEIQPDARDAVNPLKNAVPLAADVIPYHETPCFAINQIELIGDSASKFKFALNEVLNVKSNQKPILDSCLGVIGINAVMTRVQNVIIAKGYVTTRVLAAPQDLKLSNPTTEDFLSDYGVVLCKLAWLKGFEVQVDSPLVPMAFMPVAPLPHYDDVYEFLKPDRQPTAPPVEKKPSLFAKLFGK